MKTAPMPPVPEVNAPPLFTFSVALLSGCGGAAPPPAVGPAPAPLAGAPGVAGKGAAARVVGALTIVSVLCVDSFGSFL